ncbi:SpoIIE family protein phosphatase [Streptomyces sp. NPDC002265]|uniref:SpoIIE family protein phosphatase n=1 Tax=Streptomyces sp. NPDC002265 TaxID=3154415 RepID=UPI00332FCD45
MTEAPPPQQPSVPTGQSAAALLDGAGNVIGWSEAAESLLGHRASDILGHSADAVLTPAGGAPPRPGSGEWSGIARLRHASGHDLELGVRMCAMPDPSGRAQWLMTASVPDPGDGALRSVNRSLLDGLLSHSPIGMAVMDTSLRYVWINEALVRTSGAPDRIGRTVSAVFPAGQVAAGEAKMRRVLETGEPLIDFEYRGPILSDPTGEHMYSASFFRMEDRLGEPIGLCYLVIDVTERWKRRRRELMLSRARACGKQLDLMQTAQELSEICVPDFADLVTIDLLDSVVRGTETAACAEGALFLQHAGHKAGSGVRATALGGIGSPVVYRSSPGVAQSLATGAGILESPLDAMSSQWAQGAPGRSKLIHGHGFHSSITVPLSSGGTALGLATFMRAADGQPFSDEDLQVAEEFAVHASSALAAAHRFTQERRISLSLQRSLLPGRLGPDEAVDVAWRYFPASQEAGVGGDWVDVIPLSGARVALVVGDVVGHGVSAAAAMGRLRAAVHTLAAMDLPPDELLAHLDDFVTSLYQEQPARKDCTEGDVSLPGTIGATCLYAVYDPVARTCTIARAGHPAPVIMQPDGTTATPDLPMSSPLGVGDTPFEAAEIPCPDGSLLAFFTDGLVDNRDQEMDEGVARLRSVLRDTDTSLEELCDATVDALLSRPLEDDAALLLVKPTSFPSADVATWDIPDDPAAVRQARALANRQLEGWGLHELQFTTELIVSELVTNAIRYGSPPIRLRLIRHSALTCEVIDANSTSPRLRHARTTDEGGRGLFLVAQASQRWGYRYTGSGKSIWSEQDLS